jgi:EAL domain-containing protein (putative c-di-GMP-specific phosphodiesterase class I)
MGAGELIMRTGARTAAIVGNVAEVLIAESIEEPAGIPTLQDLGVPWGQGYLISRPAPRQPVRA